MNMEAQITGRWIGLLVAGALTLGACGSGTEAPTAALAGETPDLALVDDVADDAEISADDSAESMMLDLDDLDSLEDLDGVEMTPELFDALRSSEVMRPLVIEEMMNEGLTEDQAGCFFDNVSPGLFVVFGKGEAPDDDQFAELMDLLVVCEISFTAAP